MINSYAPLGSRIIAILSEEDYIKLIVPPELVPQFKQLISRALNAYPDAHPALKEFGDKLEHGRILQDYYSQRTDIKAAKLPMIYTDAMEDTMEPVPIKPISEYLICSHCQGRGAHHRHDCPTLLKK